MFKLAAKPLKASIATQQFRMLTSHAVVFSGHGNPADVLKTHTYEIDDENIASDSIIIKTLGAPINPSDVNQVEGVYPSQPEKTTLLGTAEPSAVGGNEGLFEVVKVGNGVSSLSAGDWVIPTTVNYGTWRTYGLCKEGEMTKIPNPTQSKAANKPNGLSINQGATISVNPLTAYLMMTHYVKLQPGKDWFIQNGGNSAVGQYAVQIAKLLGINSLSVVRDRPDLDKLIQTMTAKGATKVITDEQNNSKEFGPEVKSWVKATGGEIKLALNCVGGKSSTGIARKLAPNGLMLTYGGMSKQPVILPTSLHIFKNITSTGFWVTALTKNDIDLKKKTLQQIIAWYEEGKLEDAPSVETAYAGDKPLSEVFVEAIQNSKNGKQLITF